MIKEQAEKTAEAFAAGFLNDTFGQDLFLNSQIERVLAGKVHLIYQFIDDASFYGAAITHENGEQFVVLNTAHALRTRYFTAAHELWHLSDASKMQKDDFDHERAADRFAASLMLPKPLVKSLWKQFKSQWNEEQAILYIADLSAAPYKTVERRIREVGEVIKKNHTEEEWKKLREKYFLPTSPLDSAIAENKFSAHENQVKLHLNKGLDPLTASNKLAHFSPKVSMTLKEEALNYE